MSFLIYAHAHTLVFRLAVPLFPWGITYLFNFISIYIFETRSCDVAQAGLELMVSLLSQPPGITGVRCHAWLGLHI